jgi:hypothetical protein
MRAGAALRLQRFNASAVGSRWQLSRDELDVVFLDWFLFSRVN